MAANTAQKILIKTLTQTHPNPQTAFKKAEQLATTEEDRQHLKKIAGALGVKF